LGGSVAKGGMAFTEFSKTFFDSGLTENLRQMGYTSKDLNEVLATQIGFQKSTTDTSVAGQLRASQAAAELATEMDLIAKQTGKSRKEQEASLEKAKADGQIEAKMRLIGLQQGADAEKAAREGFAKQYAQAEAMGTGQVFKEMFATGTVRSQEAAMQMGLLGDAARGTAESAKALSKGNMEASQASMETAKIGNLANQKNEALLIVASTGTGAAADVMKKNIESNDAAYHGAVKTAAAMGAAMSDVTTVLGAQKKAIQDEQEARHGATAALISGTARFQDLKAVGVNTIAKPLNSGTEPGSLNQSLLNLSKETSQGIGAKDTNSQIAKRYAQAAVNNASQGGPVSAGFRTEAERLAAPLAEPLVKTADKVAGGLVEGGIKVANKVVNFGAEVLNVMKFNGPNRDEGTMGKTGQPFEPQDFIGKVQKGEMVLTQEQAQRFLSGAKMEGMANAVQELSKSMPKLDVASMAKNIKINTSAMPKPDIAGSAKNVKIDTASMSKPEDMMGMVKNLIPSGFSGMTAGLENNDGKTTAPGAVDPNIKAGGQTPGPSGMPASPKPSPGAGAAFDRAGFKMPSFDQISIGADGMPKITAKPQAQTVPTAVEKKKEEELRKVGKEQGAEAETAAREAAAREAAGAKTSNQPAPTGQKVATLDDVAKLLSSLNTTMSKLSESAMETNRLTATQIKVTKGMSGNVHDRQ
jgi:hypothetical protein